MMPVTDQRRRIAADGVESDTVALAVIKLLDAQPIWSGPAGELLADLTPAQAPGGWPADGR